MKKILIIVVLIAVSLYYYSIISFKYGITNFNDKGVDMTDAITLKGIDHYDIPFTDENIVVIITKDKRYLKVCNDTELKAIQVGLILINKDVNEKTLYVLYGALIGIVVTLLWPKSKKRRR